MLRRVVTGALFVALGWAGANACAQTAWKPQRNIEILIASTAGTGPDRLARIIQRIWQEQKIMDVTSSVVSKPGGGGTILWAYLSQRTGDGHHLMITSYNIVVNHITGKSALTHTDFTPISLLVSEYIGYDVRADSPIKSIADLVDAFRKDPGAFPIAVSSNAGGASHIAVSLFLKAAGVDIRKIRVVVFSGYNEATAALLGGHVGLIAGSAGSIAPFLANGQTRTLALAAPQRLDGIYAVVPTLTESGFPVVANNWRLVMAPKGLTAAQTAFWDDVFKRLTTSEEWNKELRSRYLSNNYLNSDETRKYLAQHYGEIKQILTEIGLAKQPN